MSTTVKVKTFVKEFVALVKGDDAEVVAAKVQRKAESALETRLSVINGKIGDAKDRVKDCEENLVKARLNYGNEISSDSYGRDNYVDKLITATIQLDKANSELENLEHTRAMLSRELAIVRS